MARQPRFQYPGALYHVMARGNGGDAVVVTDDDRKVFLHRLGQVCESCETVEIHPKVDNTHSQFRLSFRISVYQKINDWGQVSHFNI